MQQKIVELTNGFKIILVNLPESSSCTANLYLPAGYKYDPQDKPGLAHISEHMMLAGTKKYPTSKDLASVIARLGGIQTAFTWIDYQLHTVRVPKGNLKEAIEVLQQTTQFPLLSEVELEKEKQSIVEEINKDKSEPSIKVWDYAWNEAFWKGTHLARSYTGSVNDLNNISIIDVRKFIEKILFKNAILSISGNFKDEDTLNVVEKYFGNVKINVDKLISPNIEPHAGRSIKILPSLGENNYLMFGFKTVRRNHNDSYILQLISRLLGGSFSGILVNKLRERGFIYDWILDQDLLQKTGYIYFKTSTSKDFVDEVIKTTCEAFKMIAEGKVSKEEFEMAQSQTIGELLLNMETTIDYSSWFGEQEFLTGTSYTPQEIAKTYKKIKMESMIEIAKKYFIDANWYLGIVGEANTSNLEGLINRSLK